ncbi:hypothetical protein CEXT_199701 [Caerostris extrusa]|uniref:Uncharacterized protein n=1 Tax=Caerostris extrusa TaxID=172846 RepID=A0AAV4MGI7_CAEEX|nr:hypothetical protein CEXT_199701 [Caerostris extrusa]
MRGQQGWGGKSSFLEVGADLSTSRRVLRELEGRLDKSTREVNDVICLKFFQVVDSLPGLVIRWRQTVYPKMEVFIYPYNIRIPFIYF